MRCVDLAGRTDDHLTRCHSCSVRAVRDQRTPSIRERLVFGWRDSDRKHLACLLAHDVREPLLDQVMRMEACPLEGLSQLPVGFYPKFGCP